MTDDLMTAKLLICEARNSVDRALHFLAKDTLETTKETRMICARVSTEAGSSYAEEALACLREVCEDLAIAIKDEQEQAPERKRAQKQEPAQEQEQPPKQPPEHPTDIQKFDTGWTLQKPENK